MLAIKAERIKEDTILQTKVVNKINSGKKPVFKFDSEEAKIAFLEQSCKLATQVGATAGTAIGGLIGGAIGGPIGFAIGGAIGSAVGAFIGESIGVWLANFLWENVVNKGALFFKEKFSWFGLAPNRLIARTC